MNLEAREYARAQQILAAFTTWSADDAPEHGLELELRFGDNEFTLDCMSIDVCAILVSAMEEVVAFWKGEM